LSSHKFLTDTSFPRQPISTLLRKSAIKKASKTARIEKKTAAKPATWSRFVDDVIFSDRLWNQKDIALLLENPSAIRYIPETTINRISDAISKENLYKNPKTNQMARDLVNQWDFLRSQPIEPVVQRKRYVAQGDVLDFNTPARRAATTNVTQPKSAETTSRNENNMTPEKTPSYLRIRTPHELARLDRRDAMSRQVYNYRNLVDNIQNKYENDLDRYRRGKLSEPPKEPVIPSMFRRATSVRNLTPEQQDRRLQAAQRRHKERFGRGASRPSDATYDFEMPKNLQAIFADPVARKNWYNSNKAIIARSFAYAGDTDPVTVARLNISAGNTNPYSSSRPRSTNSTEAPEPTVYPKGVQLLATADGYTNPDLWLDNIDNLPDRERQAAYGRIKNANTQITGITEAEFKRLMTEAKKKYIAEKDKAKRVLSTSDAFEPSESSVTRSARTRRTSDESVSVPSLTPAPAPAPAPKKEPTWAEVRRQRQNRIADKKIAQQKRRLKAMDSIHGTNSLAEFDEDAMRDEILDKKPKHGRGRRGKYSPIPGLTNSTTRSAGTRRTPAGLFTPANDDFLDNFMVSPTVKNKNSKPSFARFLSNQDMLSELINKPYKYGFSENEMLQNMLGISRKPKISTQLKQVASQIGQSVQRAQPVRAIGRAFGKLPRKTKIGIGIGAALLGANALMNKRATVSKRATPSKGTTVSKSAKMIKNHHNKYF